MTQQAGPAGAKTPTQRDRATRSMIPDGATNAYFVNMPYGNGVIVKVSVAANTPITIPHTLNRVPNRIEVLDNGTGFTCGYARTGTWTTANVFAQFASALTNAWVAIL